VRGVDLLGVGATRFSDASRPPAVLAREAIAAALADAGLAPHDVATVAVASGGEQAPAAALVALDGGRHRRPPICVSGASAIQVAWQAVATGACDVALCVGQRATAEAPDDGGNVAELAEGARRYMAASGATEAHLARVAAKNRAHGARNPRALLRAAVDADAVLASELLEWPLRRLMVAQPAQGAAAAVLGATDRPRRGGPAPLRVRCSVVVRHGDGDVSAAAHGAARLGYLVTGIGPEEVDCAEVDHPTAAGEIAAYEALQLVPDGQGPELVESGFTALGGVLPVNASGGPLAQGRAAGASAVAQVCELAWQLRGQAGRRQVLGARVGIALGTELHEDGSSVAAAALTIVSAG
jgi:acetyl-CoA acetyltransferase